MVPKDTEAWKLQYMKSPGWHCFSCWGHWEVLSHARCQPVGEGSSLKPLLVQPLLVACCTGEEPGRILSVSVCESVHALPWPHFLSVCLSVPCHGHASCPCVLPCCHYLHTWAVLWHPVALLNTGSVCVSVLTNRANLCKLLSLSYAADSSKAEAHFGSLHRAD